MGFPPPKKDPAKKPVDPPEDDEEEEDEDEPMPSSKDPKNPKAKKKGLQAWAADRMSK